MSFAMTMLSWSVLEYKDKYMALNEYEHTRQLIKWGTDYLLLTFNNSATKINKIYAQVWIIHSHFFPHSLTFFLNQYHQEEINDIFIL